MAMSWEAIVSDTKSAREAGLAKVEPKLQGLPAELPRNSTGLAKVVLSQKELEITEDYTISQLLAALRERKLSVEEVTRAYLRRAALAQAAVSAGFTASGRESGLTCNVPDQLFNRSPLG
jgi:amidase